MGRSGLGKVSLALSVGSDGQQVATENWSCSCLTACEVPRGHKTLEDVCSGHGKCATRVVQVFCG